ncbi:MAG: DUF1566 domain-containing protein, partial [Spirochaetes bacterium]|nr:DUF1566 domain-containing protein [Spirochaetota bacterium]
GSGQPWRTGGITLPATGGVTFLAYAVNSGGQHLYSAPSTITDISNLATNPSLTADTGYTVGGFGPAGGYIAYSSSNHYIEVAPKGWSGTLGTTADPVATIWGPSMAGGTTVQNTAIGTGKDNTSAFNSKITGTTYKVASGNTLNASGTGYAVNDVLSIDNTFGGQVKVATLSGTAVATIAGGANNIKGATSSAAGSFATTNVTHPGVGTGCTITIALNTTSYSNFAFARAKVANTNAVNGYTDWMLPSSAEMTQIYTAFSSAPATYGLVAAGWYWSSTEVAATIANAWAIQFSASKTITSKVKTTSTYLVHPARYF